MSPCIASHFPPPENAGGGAWATAWSEDSGESGAWSAGPDDDLDGPSAGTTASTSFVGASASGAQWIGPQGPFAALARLRYSSAVATIQIREVPEEAYEVLRRRARQAGQSIQAYMRDEIVAIAARPTKSEAVLMIETILGHTGKADPTARSILADLAAERR